MSFTPIEALFIAEYTSCSCIASHRTPIGMRLSASRTFWVHGCNIISIGYATGHIQAKSSVWRQRCLSTDKLACLQTKWVVYRQNGLSEDNVLSGDSPICLEINGFVCRQARLSLDKSTCLKTEWLSEDKYLSGDNPICLETSWIV